MARPKKLELIDKSREAMMTAVQTYNNPLISFKSENFIVLAIISWTYLMHAYFHENKIEYRYYKTTGQRKRYDRTKFGAFKFWELERCLNDERSPIDKDASNNLRFLIGIRNEIEHQMTNKIDEYIGAKLQACAINYNYYLVKLFGEKYNIEQYLALSIQFSPIIPIQEDILLDNNKLLGSINNFIVDFESDLSESELKSEKYAYRICYVPISVNRANQADRAVEFVKSGSEMAKDVERVLLKDREKKKFLPTQIVKLMNDEGYDDFTISKHTKLWQGKDAKNPKHNYGVRIVKQWYWYENWVEEVRKHCKKNYISSN